MKQLRQAAQPLDQALTGMLHDVDIDAIHLVQFERVDAAPVGSLVYLGRIPTVGGVYCQDDDLRIGGADSFVCDLWVATTAGIVVEDVAAVGVLQEFVAKGTTAKDVGFARRTIIDFQQHPGRRRACHGCLDLVDLQQQLVHKRYGSALCEGQASDQQDLLEHS